MTMTSVVLDACTATNKRYLTVWGMDHGTCFVFDRLEERVVYKSVRPEGEITSSSKPCEAWIGERCAESVVAALREAGYLPE